MQKANLEAVRRAIRERQTFKVLSDLQNPVEFSEVSANDDFVRKAVADSGWAPFHYDRKLHDVAEPWRCHILWHQDCRKVARKMTDWFSDMKPTNKLPSMLSACGALVLVTWLPVGENDIADVEKRKTVNEEHLAATSAMIQNLLLICTAGGYGSYWSSGGQFKTPQMFERLSIPGAEKLAAAIFVDYPQSHELELERLPGKNRAKRSGAEKWTREIDLG